MSMVGKRPYLTPEQARHARELAQRGVTQTVIGQRLGINRRTVGAYIRGQHKRREYA